MEVFMKSRLTKVLFISLLLSAAVSSTMQASLLNWATWKSGIVNTSNQIKNFLSKNIEKFSIGSLLAFSRKHPVAVGGTVAVATVCILQPKFLGKLGLFQGMNFESICKLLKTPKEKKREKLLKGFREAVEFGDIQKIEKLFEEVENDSQRTFVNTALDSITGNNALIIAAKMGNVKIAEFLVEKGADVNGENISTETALTKASYHGHSGMVEFLVDKKADINKKGRIGGSTALMHAAMNGKFEVSKFLIDSGACVDEEDEAGYTALM
ncbi:MAG TPA: ankyrin repeat domain-containing protein, partial [Candidatus Dependentiae bacterium]|nr:ankyrin repeat domain-containing protein [Candidatus Dependentiae bacterium]